MAVPNILPGYQLLLSRVAPGGTVEFLCTVVTKNLGQKMNFDEAMLPDCDSIGQVPVLALVPSGKRWDLSFSGKLDARRRQVFQSDYDSGVTHTYRLEIALSGALGGGYYEGVAFIEEFSIASTDNGITTFSGTLRGHGDLFWTAAA